MKKRIFINQEGDSNKIWSIHINAVSFTVEFGKIDAKPRENTKSFSDESSCVTKAEKLRNGYKEVQEGEAIPQKIERAYRPMDEEEFWYVISLFNWKKTGDDDAVVKPAVQKLVSMTVEDIHQFSEILAEKLYMLDGIEYASNIGTDSYSKDGNFSSDYFLYMRCCVVANGKDFYYEVLNDPKNMPKELDFEPLLGVAESAYNIKMNTKDEYLKDTKYSYESFSNAKAWHKDIEK